VFFLCGALPERFVLFVLYLFFWESYCFRMLHFNHFSEILKSEFEHRQNMNESYSLRGFAQKLGIAPSKISEILNHKQGLSEKLALKICNELRFSQDETNHFINTVKAHCSKSPKVRAEYTKILEQRNRKIESFDIQESLFSIISNWYHFAILELMNTEDFQSGPKWISKRLSISLQDAKHGIQNLEKLGLIEEKNNDFKPTGVNLRTSDGIGSSSIKKFNDQILTKAKDAIYEQDVSKRHLSTLTVGVNEEIIPEVFEKISAFRKELNQFISNHSKNNNTEAVYCFSSQFFELTHEEKNEQN
jgi:uncharacterized protein (TIGR02147 family)